MSKKLILPYGEKKDGKFPVEFNENETCLVRNFLDEPSVFADFYLCMALELARYNDAKIDFIECTYSKEYLVNKKNMILERAKEILGSDEFEKASENIRFYERTSCSASSIRSLLQGYGHQCDIIFIHNHEALLNHCNPSNINFNEKVNTTEIDQQLKYITDNYSIPIIVLEDFPTDSVQNPSLNLAMNIYSNISGIYDYYLEISDYLHDFSKLPLFSVGKNLISSDEIDEDTEKYENVRSLFVSHCSHGFETQRIALYDNEGYCNTIELDETDE